MVSVIVTDRFLQDSAASSMPKLLLSGLDVCSGDLSRMKFPLFVGGGWSHTFFSQKH